MLARIRQYLAPPIFENDEDATRLARFVNYYAWIILVSTLFFCIVWLLTAPELAWRLVFAAPMFPLAGAILFFLHRKRIRPASQILVAGLWIILFVAAAFSGGVHAPAMGGFIVVVLLAALLLGRGPALLWAVASIVGSLGLVIAENSGFLLGEDASTPIAIWASYVTYLLVSSILLRMATTNIEESLARARQEISQREQTEIALRQSERKFGQAFHSSPIAMSISAPGIGMIDVNDAYLRLTGHTRDEVIGKSSFDLGLWVDEESHRLILHTLETTGEINNVEFQFQKRSGETGTGLISAVLIEIGTLEGALASIIDITERKLGEEALLEAELRYRTLVEQLPAVIYRDLPDEAGTNLYISPHIERLTGYPAEAWLDNPTFWQDLLHPDDRDHIIADHIHNVATGSGSVTEYRLKVRSGGWVWVRDTSTMVKDANGRALFVQGVMSDITEQKEAEEEIRRLNAELEKRVIRRTAQLEATNRELEAFSYSVSHDLRAPLRAIDGFTKILSEEYADQVSPEARRYLGIVRDNTHKMGRLIEDLLAFSRLGRSALDRQPLQIKKVCLDYWQETASQRAGRVIDLVVDDFPPCRADSALMRIVFANLIDNAVKFTRGAARASIHIGPLTQDGQKIIHIRDNGIGFDMRYADKLFGVFQRLHREDEFEGTGIGLATVKRIINRHGGEIWAEAAPGEGAAFYFTLPEEE